MGGGGGQAGGGGQCAQWEISPLPSHSPVLLATKKGETLPHLSYHPQVPKWTQEGDRAWGGLQRMLPASSIFSFLLHRNTMSLLSEITFNYHFGNQRRLKEPQGRRKTYLCYKLKLLDETLDKGYFTKKVPSGPPGSRAGGADPVRCAGQTPTHRWA